MIQFINNEGDFIVAAALKPDRTLCMAMFRWMLYVRTFDTEVLLLQRAGRISFCNPSTGQEANQIGSAFALSPEDWVFPSYRVAGVYLFRKGSPLALLNQLYGNDRDLSRGRQLPMHFGDRSVNFVSVSSPVGTQISQAVGVSIAAKATKQPVVAIAYFSDGGTSTNDFHAGLNLAGVLKTPTIFYCENNQYALSVPLHRQTASESIAAKGAAYGIPSLQIDGNDVLAVYAAVRQAVDHARGGAGPMLLEAITYRQGLHSSSDEPSLYRTAEEEEEWKINDPILRCRKFLQKEGWWSAEWEDETRRDQLAQMRTAIDESEGYPPPPPDSLFDDVWAELTPRLEAQRQYLGEQLEGHDTDFRDFKFPI
jgi:pyruvate dehydrogenase E1 component alpha subunit/2-oxoisovalerate dehydrogenase E1 component alpha subunit